MENTHKTGLEENWLEGNFSRHEPIFYKQLFWEYLGTGIYKLGPEEFSI